MSDAGGTVRLVREAVAREHAHTACPSARGAGAADGGRSARVATLMPAYDGNSAHAPLRMLDPASGLAPGDPARMAARIIESVEAEPAPLRRSAQRQDREAAAGQRMQDVEVPVVEGNDRLRPVARGEDDVRCVGDTDPLVRVALDDRTGPPQAPRRRPPAGPRRRWPARPGPPARP